MGPDAGIESDREAAVKPRHYRTDSVEIGSPPFETEAVPMHCNWTRRFHAVSPWESWTMS